MGPGQGGGELGLARGHLVANGAGQGAGRRVPPPEVEEGPTPVQEGGREGPARGALEVALEDREGLLQERDRGLRRSRAAAGLGEVDQDRGHLGVVRPPDRSHAIQGSLEVGNRLFMELYGQNANRAATGQRMEDHWQEYYDLARDAQDVLPANGTLDARVGTFAVGAWAHITGDLAPSLKLVYDRKVAAGADPAETLASMRRDFERSNGIFGRVTDEYLSDEERAGWATSRAWGLLPGVAQDALASERQPFGARVVLEAARSRAWDEFEQGVQSGGYTVRNPDGGPPPAADDLLDFQDFPRQQLRPNRPQGLFDGFREGFDPQSSFTPGEGLPGGDMLDPAGAAPFGVDADPGVGGLAGNYGSDFGAPSGVGGGGDAFSGGPTTEARAGGGEIFG